MPILKKLLDRTKKLLCYENVALFVVVSTLYSRCTNIVSTQLFSLKPRAYLR